MRTPSTSRRVAPLLFVTASLSLLALHCSSDDGTPSGTAGTTNTLPTSGSGGTASQGGSSSGMASGGVMTAGTSTGGTATAGTSASTAGASGTATGGGGSGAGGTSAGGTSAGGSGGSGGGGSSPLFAAVKAQMAKSCGVNNCHKAGSGELVYQMLDDATLYKNLTTPIPDGTKHCQGSTAIVANDANSLLLKLIKGGSTCMNKGQSQNIAQMPDDCPKPDRPCLTTEEQKTFTDWVAAGAPK